MSHSDVDEEMATPAYYEYTRQSSMPCAYFKDQFLTKTNAQLFAKLKYELKKVTLWKNCTRGISPPTDAYCADARRLPLEENARFEYYQRAVRIGKLYDAMGKNCNYRSAPNRDEWYYDQMTHTRQMYTRLAHAVKQSDPHTFQSVVAEMCGKISV